MDLCVLYMYHCEFVLRRDGTGVDLIMHLFTQINMMTVNL